ncbi:hypothetical protein CL616_01640 [archaeon]|nr:hypothetical protein [archaeon]|tara:strand:- start:163 stop:738 length:576 start_codon:yes stop_codon:yes gene_type:complete
MKPYIQTTEYTTAASSLLTILAHFKILQPTRENELKIWKNTILPPTRASSVHALANQAIQLSPTLILETTDYEFPDYRFYRYTKQDIELAKELSQFYKTNNKVKTIIQPITINDINKLITTHYILIRLNTKYIRDEKRNTSNYLLLIEKNKLIDPKQGLITINDEQLNQAFNTLKTKKHRSHKMIIFAKQQ